MLMITRTVTCHDTGFQRHAVYRALSLNSSPKAALDSVEQCIYRILSHSCPLLMLVKVFKRIRSAKTQGLWRTLL